MFNNLKNNLKNFLLLLEIMRNFQVTSVEIISSGA